MKRKNLSKVKHSLDKSKANFYNLNSFKYF